MTSSAWDPREASALTIASLSIIAERSAAFAGVLPDMYQQLACSRVGASICNEVAMGNMVESVQLDPLCRHDMKSQVH